MLRLKTITAMGVNCYLLQTETGYYLIDSGFASKRAFIEKALLNEGCQPGDLKLIIHTHGDSDHCGNSVYFRERYGAKLAIHAAEVESVRSGNLLKARSHTPAVTRFLLTLLLPLAGLDRKDRFTPDIIIEDGMDFSSLGLPVTVLFTPGHSNGSISLLGSEGDLFCGDLMTNTEKPLLNTNMDDLAAGAQSLRRLQTYPIQQVYPGHGEPFKFSDLP
jgi:hydroxyacylglutathione hydrolase